MPTWGQILAELKQTAARPERQGLPDHDGVRRKYLARLSEQTGRATIIYYTAFTESREGIPPLDLQIHLGDVQAFMECMSGPLEGPSLDLMLHSPGGTAEATESIVSYLRTRFDYIRAIVPVAAMSAATMLALSCNEILMGRHSQLGPIDPQFVIQTPDGPRASPGQAILDQFEMAKEECKDPSNLAAWMPILRSYLPGLLAQCHDQRAAGERMVSQWMAEYMFASESGAEQKAEEVAKWFADYQRFKSHGRPVRIEQLRELGVRVTALEDDQALQDAVLSAHHSTMHTFIGTPASKIVENNLGKSFIRISGRMAVMGERASPRGGQEAPLPRPERRRQQRERR